MMKLKIKFKREFISSLKFILLAITFSIIVISKGLIELGKTTNEVVNVKIYLILSLSIFSLLVELSIFYLLSAISPIKILKFRKKLLLFTYLLTKQVENESFIHSIEYHYKYVNEKYIVEIYSNGLIDDKTRLAKRLSEYLRLELLDFKELTDKICLKFSKSKKALNGVEVISNDEL